MIVIVTKGRMAVEMYNWWRGQEPGNYMAIIYACTKRRLYPS